MVVIFEHSTSYHGGASARTHDREQGCRLFSYFIYLLISFLLDPDPGESSRSRSTSLPCVLIGLSVIDHLLFAQLSDLIFGSVEECLHVPDLPVQLLLVVLEAGQLPLQLFPLRLPAHHNFSTNVPSSFGISYRRSITTEEKAKVVATVWGDRNESLSCNSYCKRMIVERDEFVLFFISSWCISSYSSNCPVQFILFFKLSCVQNS